MSIEFQKTKSMGPTDETALLSPHRKGQFSSKEDGGLVPYDQLEDVSTNFNPYEETGPNRENNEPNQNTPLNTNPLNEVQRKEPLSDAILARFLPISYYIIYFLLSSMQELPMTSIAWLLNKSTKFTPEELTIYYNLCFIPWTIKPLWGFIADNIPICGYRRKPYMIFFSMVASVVFVAMTFYSTNKGYMRMFGILQALCVVFSEVQVDGLVIAYSNTLLTKQRKLMKLFPAFEAILEPQEEEKDKKSEKVTPVQILKENPTYSKILTQHEYQLLSTRFPKALIQSEAMTMRTTSSLIASIISLILHLFLHPKGVIRASASVPIALIVVIICLVNENGKGTDETAKNNKRYREIAQLQEKINPSSEVNNTAALPLSNDDVNDNNDLEGSDCKDCHGCRENDHNKGNSADDDIVDSSYLPEAIDTTAMDLTNAKFYQSCACPEHKSYYELKKEAQKDSKNSGSTLSLLPKKKSYSSSPASSASSSDSDIDSSSSPLSFCLSCFVLRVKAVFGAIMIIWKPLLFMLILRSVPTPTDPMMSYIFGHLTLPPWLLSGYSFITISGGLLASVIYWKFFVNFAIIPAFILFTILAATIGSLPNYAMTSSWVHLHINIPDWGWVFCSAFVSSIFARFSMMPTLILAAETAPQHFGLEATMFSIYTAVNNIGNLVSVAGNLYLIKKLHITFEDFSGLPTMIIICSIVSILPLFFSPLIWCTQRDLKQLDVEQRKAKLNRKLKKQERLEKQRLLELDDAEENEGLIDTDFSSINHHLDINNLKNNHNDDGDGYGAFFHTSQRQSEAVNHIHDDDSSDGDLSSPQMKKLVEQQRALRRYKLTQIAQDLAMSSNDKEHH
jgi:MFS family permease